MDQEKLKELINALTDELVRRGVSPQNVHVRWQIDGQDVYLRQDDEGHGMSVNAFSIRGNALHVHNQFASDVAEAISERFNLIYIANEVPDSIPKQ